MRKSEVHTSLLVVLGDEFIHSNQLLIAHIIGYVAKVLEAHASSFVPLAQVPLQSLSKSTSDYVVVNALGKVAG